jgi:hypothetical protein
MKYKNCWKRFERDPEYFECSEKNIVMKIGSAVVIRRPNANNDFSYMVAHHIVIEDLCVQVVNGFCRPKLELLIEDILGRRRKDKGARNELKKLQEFSKNSDYWKNTWD